MLDANADANANDDDDKMIIDFQRFINLKYLKFYDITLILNLYYQMI